MSVFIKGINVHRGRCYECPCLDGEYGDCNVLEKDVHYITKEECPWSSRQKGVKNDE